MDKNTHTATTRFCIALCALMAFLPMIAIAQDTQQDEPTVHLLLRPHCAQGYSNEEWIYGSVPPPGWPAGNDMEACPPFSVRDPQMLQTQSMNSGAILDMDLVIENPQQLSIEEVRAWIDFDPTVLEGQDLSISTDTFTHIDPSEQFIDSQTSQIKIRVSNPENSDLPAAYWIPVARLQLKINQLVQPGTVLSFFDVQSDGHTFITAKDTQGNTVSVLPDDPGALLVRMEAAATDEPTVDDVSSGTGSSSAPSDTLDASSANSEPHGIIAVGQPCVVNSQCRTNLCTEGICQDPEQTQNDRTAFSQLQVRNVRITTEEGTAYLAWEDLPSSMLKAYNVYYGTTSGQYIQRKTIPGGTPSLSIRNLPVGSMYYFAVRAVSIQDEESSFSREVGIEVGNPASSTAPLVGSVLTDAPGEHPLGNGDVPSVPGETGIPSSLLLLLLGSAIAGTIVAARRQILIAATNT